jgi:hypothetical protein
LYLHTKNTTGGIGWTPQKRRRGYGHGTSKPRGHD